MMFFILPVFVPRLWFFLTPVFFLFGLQRTTPSSFEYGNPLQLP